MNLINTVGLSSLDHATEQYAHRKLGMLYEAVSDYRLRGINPLKDTIESIHGSAWSDLECVQNVTQNECGEKFWSIACKAAAIVSLVQSLLMYLPEELKKEPTLIRVIESVQEPQKQLEDLNCGPDEETP